MAKRFTDTDKWKKPFIRGLQGAYKLLWLYICDDCDHAGIWHVDIDVAAIRIGEKINEQKAIESFSTKIIVFAGGEKWFMPSFLDFQYPGGLNEKNKVHNSVIQILKKYNLIDDELKPLASPLQAPFYGAKDKDKEKDKEKELDKVKEINIDFPFFWNEYDKKVGDKDKLKKKWDALTDAERFTAMEHIPRYKEAQPDKKFRKDPGTYLNNKSFNDEIIYSNGQQPITTGNQQLISKQQQRQATKREYYERHHGNSEGLFGNGDKHGN